MGNCDKKSTGNRKFTGKCPTFYVFFKLRGISRQQIFRGIYRKSRKIRSIARKFTENLQKNRKFAVNI